MYQEHKHIINGDIYKVMHLAQWRPGGEPSDMAEVHIMRDDLTGEVKVGLASDPDPALHSNIAGGYLQIAEETKLASGDTVVVYVGADTKVWVRELKEFNLRFDPIVIPAEPKAEEGDAE